VAANAGPVLEAVGPDGEVGDRHPEGSQGRALTTGRHIPQRSCVACAQKLSKRDLIRIVRTPQGAVTVDRSGKMAGRGAYLCWSQACWTQAMSKGGVERSLKLNLSIQDKAQLLAFYEEAIAGSSSEAG
jgi:predicted RNA-binding protein YlxR (DUF448 family)